MKFADKANPKRQKVGKGLPRAEGKGEMKNNH